jgi:hypothetical protein
MMWKSALPSIARSIMLRHNFISMAAAAAAYELLQIPKGAVFPTASASAECQRWFEQGYAWCAG